MGSDKGRAIASAKQLNSILMVQDDLVSAVLGAATFESHIDWMKENILPEREYSKSTLDLYYLRFKQLVEAFGSTAIEEVNLHMISSLLEKQTPRVSNQLRQVAVDVFKVAMSRGLCQDNPAELTLKRVEKKARKRLTKEQFDLIYAEAPTWLKNAMDIALITLQRREDITLMRFENIKDGHLYVVQQKTKKHDSGYLKIKVGDKLGQVLRRCRDNVASPFIIHRRPEKIVKRETMDHWTQIKPEMVSRQFKKITDKVLSDMPSAERPTFHEIRALGIKQYKDKGLDPQQLAGHASEIMTKNYDSGHEEIRWIEVEAI